MNLSEYFILNYLNKSRPVTDYALRVESSIDGTVRFYLHPQGKGDSIKCFEVFENSLMYIEQEKSIA